MDKSGGAAFQSKLKKSIRNVPGLGARLKKVKIQDSHKNNLLQLADYCVGIHRNKLLGRADRNQYYRYIAPKKISKDS